MKDATLRKSVQLSSPWCRQSLRHCSQPTWVALSRVKSDGLGPRGGRGVAGSVTFRPVAAQPWRLFQLGHDRRRAHFRRKGDGNAPRSRENKYLAISKVRQGPRSIDARLSTIEAGLTGWLQTIEMLAPVVVLVAHVVPRRGEQPITLQGANLPFT